MSFYANMRLCSIIAKLHIGLNFRLLTHSLHRRLLGYRSVDISGEVSTGSWLGREKQNSSVLVLPSSSKTDILQQAPVRRDQASRSISCHPKSLATNFVPYAKAPPAVLINLVPSPPT
ncbi:hypothetical protein L484_015270 [Morus notabilis]|uniref:Uncharacterized protein n=1 Tax=Morus notabilis TaxID=981085 RepID=W9RQY5_9ROSA|nr:hypothetical protein L484_015270 [Morus notabilis]